MRNSRRSLVPTPAVVLASFTVVVALAATPAGAQQLPAARFVAEQSTSPTSAATEATAAAAADSAARYLHTARVQRWTGSSLVVAGLAGVAAAYVQFARSSRLGMNEAQAGTFATGTALGAFGLARWSTSRESYAVAARWSEVQRLAVQR